jgi:hypothetical protein
LRGQLTSSLAAIDGRIIYIGYLAKGAHVERELRIPLSGTAAAAMRATPVDISIELRDAHGTAPTVPVRFHGTVGGEGDDARPELRPLPPPGTRPSPRRGRRR